MKFLTEYEFLVTFGEDFYKQSGFNTQKVITAENGLFYEFIEFISDDKNGTYLSVKRRFYPLTMEILSVNSDIDCFVQYDNKEEMKNKIAVLESGRGDK